MSFIYVTIKNHIHNNGFALCLSLKQRLGGLGQLRNGLLLFQIERGWVLVGLLWDKQLDKQHTHWGYEKCEVGVDRANIEQDTAINKHENL